MKKVFLALYILVFHYALLGQAFNISMGVNLTSQDRRTKVSSKVSPMLGFNAQFSRDFHLWKSLQVRTELGFEQGGIKYLQPIYIETFSYSQAGGYLMFKSEHSPMYLGVGGYAGYLMSVSGFSGQEPFLLNKNNYRFYDYGIEPILGLSLDFTFISYFVEMRFHYGMNNIYRLKDNYIKNFGINFNAGVSLKIH